MLKKQFILISTVSFSILNFLLPLSTAQADTVKNISKVGTSPEKIGKPLHNINTFQAIEKNHYGITIIKNGEIVIHENGYVDTGLPLTYNNMKEISYISKVFSKNKRTINMESSYADIGQNIILIKNNKGINLSIIYSKLLQMKTLNHQGYEIQSPVIKTQQLNDNLIIPLHKSQSITVDHEVIKITHL